MPQHNTAIPAALPGYDAARRRAACFARPDRGRIVISGRDRASYLQGLLTNDVAALKTGEGCYAAYLTPQGRMISDLYVYELGETMLLAVPLAVKDALLAKFDQFIFSEEVQLGDVTDTFADVAIVGPEAAAALASILHGVERATLAALPEHGNVRATFGGAQAIVTRAADAGEPGYGVFVEAMHAAALRAALTAENIAAIGPETVDALRIEAGVPLFGVDMDEDTIPLEAGIESRAISFSKGCYVGQEVIIRVLHRGHGRVAKKLVGIVVEGAAVPARGARIAAGDRDIGVVTSSTYSPGLGTPIVLGYVHRDFMAPDTDLSIGAARGRVTALPFIRQTTD